MSSEERLPKYVRPEGNCKQCGGCTNWSEESATPIDSTNYSEQIYDVVMICNKCNHKYHLLLPSEFPTKEQLGI